HGIRGNALLQSVGALAGGGEKYAQGRRSTSDGRKIIDSGLAGTRKLVNRTYTRVSTARENFNERCPRSAPQPERRPSTRRFRPAGNDPRRQRVAKIRHRARRGPPDPVPPGMLDAML